MLWNFKDDKMKLRPITEDSLLRRGFYYSVVTREMCYKCTPIFISQINDNVWNVKVWNVFHRINKNIQTFQELNDVLESEGCYYLLNTHLTEEFLLKLGFVETSLHCYQVSSEFGFSLTIIKSSEDCFICTVEEYGEEKSSIIRSKEELKWFLEDNDLLDVIRWKE